ncbi:MAG: response regulator transcription factor [Methylococcus sp.]
MQKVLLVDDHEEIRRLMRIALGREFEVIEAGTGEEALDMITREHPQLVLLDIMMPGRLDGLEVLQIVKTTPELKDTIVVLLTARGQGRDQEAGIARGADGYFVKPFSPLMLRDFIRDKLRDQP